MLLFGCNPEVDGLKHLLETGASVNAPPDSCEQSPVHLAAADGLACFLLWQLQTGADLNQQDVFGEAPLHKAAKVGSLECLSLLVASDAEIALCNKNGQTAEDLAWLCGFPECAKFLTTVKSMQTIKSSDQSNREYSIPVLRQKRSFGSIESPNGKRSVDVMLVMKRGEEGLHFTTSYGVWLTVSKFLLRRRKTFFQVKTEFKNTYIYIYAYNILIVQTFS